LNNLKFADIILRRNFEELRIMAAELRVECEKVELKMIKSEQKRL